MARIPGTIALAAAACLGLGGIADARADSGDMPSFTVVAKDGRLSPERLEVPAGTRFKLALRNDSRAPVEFENLDLRVEKVLGPGASSFVVIRSLASGSYKFVDEFHADTAQLILIAR